VTAADVGDARAGLELLLDPVQRRDPRVDQVGDVAGAEEPLGALEQVRVVPVPADALPGPERLGDLRLVDRGRGRQLEGAGQERRAGLVGQRERLLLAEQVAFGTRGRR
jgi:hypothetical protein